MSTRILCLLGFIAIMQQACLMIPKKAAVPINAMVNRIDSGIDVLIKDYGNQPDNILQGSCDTIEWKLDSLAKITSSSIHGQPGRIILYKYMEDCKSIILLSKNPNLNINAFATALAGLGNSRAALKSRLMY